MMTREQIAAMRADAEAGTPGPWRAAEALHGPVDIFDQSGRDVVTVYGGGVTENRKANARRIARVPAMETTIIAQAAEIERLKCESGKMRAILEGAECPNLDKMLSRTETECRGYGESVAKVVWDLCRAHQATVDGSGETL